MNNAMYQLGELAACLEYGYLPADLPFIKGATARWNAEGGPAARLLLKVACDVLQVAGRGRTAPAFHLHGIVKAGMWNAHVREVCDTVGQVLQVMQPRTQVFLKQAFVNAKDIIGLGGLGMRTALLGSLAAGGGLGALAWLLNRHSSQDSAEIEAMQHQKDYYSDLARELESSMRRKYRYDSEPEAKGSLAGTPKRTTAKLVQPEAAWQPTAVAA